MPNPERKTQADRVLCELEVAALWNDIVHASVLAKVSLCYTRRIFELRQRGYRIDKVELPRVNGVRRTAYRLVGAPKNEA